LAKQAVLKIKEAEGLGRERLRAATEEARQITQSYAQNAAEQREAILIKAQHVRSGIIAAATKKAEASCEELELAAEAEKRAILNPGAERLEQAIKFITERIVSA
jgi:F0F1-type ATP synthase membrane subunit b/b'